MAEILAAVERGAFDPTRYSPLFPSLWKLFANGGFQDACSLASPSSVPRAPSAPATITARTACSAHVSTRRASHSRL
jgi:hypothetical protein